jgi:hypothetical protein
MIPLGAIQENLIPLVVSAGFILTLYELKQFEKAEKTKLENKLNKEYRELVREIPIEAMLDDDVDWDSDTPEVDRVSVIYPYIDLTNQQIFLRKKGKITYSRWKDWEEGIRIHLSQDEFQRAWEKIKDETNYDGVKSFDELRALESPPQNFDTDPHYWGVSCRRKLLRKFKEKSPLL